MRLCARDTALTIAGVAAATVAAALAFERFGGLAPCKLCLQQRWPYYVGAPLALAVALSPLPWRRTGLGLLAMLFAGSAALGLYHAGVEWGWWPGPADCAAVGSAPAPGDVGGFLRELQTARVVSCTEAAWRFAGLSLAGWNALVSAGLAAVAAQAAATGRSGWGDA